MGRVSCLLPVRPSLRRQLEEIVSYQQAEIVISSFARTVPRAPFANRFIVAVPCCGASLRFAVELDARREEVPPDVTFLSAATGGAFAAGLGFGGAWTGDGVTSTSELVADTPAVAAATLSSGDLDAEVDVASAAAQYTAAEQRACKTLAALENVSLAPLSLDEIKSLGEWDSEDRTSLLRLVLECRFLFVRRQLERVLRYAPPVVRENLAMLRDRLDGIEAFYDAHARTVRLLLPVELSPQATSCVLDHIAAPPHTPSLAIRLEVAYRVSGEPNAASAGGASGVAAATATPPPTLRFLMPRELLPFGIDRIPPPPLEAGEPLVTYVDRVMRSVNEHLLEAFEESARRRAFLEALSVALETTPIEFDSEFYMTAAYVVMSAAASKGEGALMRIYLPTRMATADPKIGLQSLQYRAPQQKLLERRWDVRLPTTGGDATAARTILSFLQRVVPEFLLSVEREHGDK